MYVTLSPSEQWCSGKSTPNSMTNDREIRPRETMQMEVTLGFCTNCIQRYQIIDNGVLALLLNVWAQTPPTYRLVVPHCRAAGVDKDY